MTAGKAIKQARLNAGVGLRELAKRLNSNQGTLSKYENDVLGISLDIADAIADALNISREALAIQCLQARYADLANQRTKIGKLTKALIDALTTS